MHRIIFEMRPSALSWWQLLQRVEMRHAGRRKMTLIGRENREAACCGRGGNRDLLEAGTMGSRTIEDRADTVDRTARYTRNGAPRPCA